MKDIIYFPHKAKTTITILAEVGIPEIIISNEAYEDMHYITSQCGRNEISWLGSVEKTENIYTINNVYLLEQIVSEASVNMSPTNIATLGTSLIKEGKIAEVNKLRFWGHLHPGHSTAPSGTDEEQMQLFVGKHTNFFIRGILGRQGKMEFTVFDYIQKLQFNDVQWTLKHNFNTERKLKIKKQIDEYVKVHKYPYDITYTPINKQDFGYNLDEWEMKNWD